MMESKIIVGFGLVTPSLDDIENALNSAQEIVNDQDVLNREIAIYPEIELGIAIISGPAVSVVANTSNKSVIIYICIIHYIYCFYFYYLFFFFFFFFFL